MTADQPAVRCERFREQISLDLDSELSQLERRMLVAHLSSCSDCGAHASDVTSFTEALRAAPLEQPERPIVVRAPRRATFARVHAGMAAAVALVVVGSALQIGLRGTENSSARTPSRFPSLAEGRNEMRQVIADGRAFDKHRSGSTVVI